MASVTASIVVGADERLVFRCLSTLRTSLGEHECAIVVTVNGQHQDLANALRQQFPGIHVVRNEQPRGFATNHNRALAGTTTDYYLVANDDVEFHGDAVAQCVAFLDQAESQAIASLSPRLVNPDGSLQRSTYGFPTITRAWLDLSGIRALIPFNRATEWLAGCLGQSSGGSRFWAHDRTREVDTFRGAAMVVRSRAWSQVGPLSEATQCGGEIAEWHRRCADAGWQQVFFPRATVMHWGNVTVGRDRLLQTEYLKGYVVYFTRHAGSGTLLAFRVAGALVSAIRLLLAIVTFDRTGVRLWLRNLRVLLGYRAPDRP